MTAQLLNIIRYPSREAWPEILRRPRGGVEELEARVQPVLEAVRQKGDEAVRHYTREFDRVELTELEVPSEEIREALERTDPELLDAMRLAARNIEAFHRNQIRREEPVETMPGVVCWRRSIPLERVGIYIPGGTAPLFSTVLMLAIPARLAGCAEIMLCSPPGMSGSVHPAILAAAGIAGVTRVFRVGGIPAIAAMAYGTNSIPAVDKIFGPGNTYVTLAKQLVQRQGVAIDLPAGPSEVAVFADTSADPAFVAADLLSQAEHGPDSQVLLVTDHEPLLHEVQSELEKQVRRLPREAIALKALGGSRAVLVKDPGEALAILNAYAPEHLILACTNAEELASRVRHAGSVFLGHFAPESVGDYASGTNHTLPTNGFARAYSGVSLDSFVRKVTFQQLSRDGLERIGPAVIRMAEAEGLRAHARAVELRLQLSNPESVSR